VLFGLAKPKKRFDSLFFSAIFGISDGKRAPPGTLHKIIPAELSPAKTITCDLASTPHLENIGHRAKAWR
jgi:hypothetical protein